MKDCTNGQPTLKLFLPESFTSKWCQGTYLSQSNLVLSSKYCQFGCSCPVHVTDWVQVDQATGEPVIMFAYRLLAVRNGLYIHMKVKEKHLSGILNDELKGNRLNREE